MRKDDKSHPGKDDAAREESLSEVEGEDTASNQQDAPAAPEEADTSEKARRLVEEVETGGRNPPGAVAWLIFALAVGWSVFQLAIASVVVVPATQARAVHLAFAIVLAFLVFPARRGQSTDRIPWYDYLFAVAAGLGVLYLVIDYTGIALRQGIVLPREVVIGSITILLLLEATRRSLGPALSAICFVFILYAMIGPRGALPLISGVMPDLLAHRGYSYDRMVSHLFITTEGIFGVPLGVSTAFVFLFVLFGAMLDKAGAGKYFIDVANSLLGTFRGGPAKAAVVASGMTGMVSGSSLANTVTTGTFTIPLMKRTGYPPHKAAACEVAVSTNGQLMPPVMGAAAFIIAEFTATSYLEVIRAAVVPAFVAYFALFYIMHLEALKLGIKGIPRAELPPRLTTFVRGLHYLVPVLILVNALVIARVSPGFAVMQAIGALSVLIVVQAPIRAYLRREPILPAVIDGFLTLVRGLEAGARNMVGIGVAVASAGIIVGVVSLTGLGLRLTEIISTVAGAIASSIGIFTLPIVDLLGGNVAAFGNTTQFAVVLIITAITSLILGLGLPTTANYIVMATLTAPIIYNLGQDFGFGVPLLAAHLFVFFFGILADDTPPVGLAAYAAAGIARTDPIKTGIQGFIYDMRTAILPFMFIFNTKLLLVGVTDWFDGIHIFISALIGMFAFSAGTQGFLMTRTILPERVVLLAIAFMLIQPTWTTDIIGASLYALVYLSQWLRQRYRTRQATAQP